MICDPSHISGRKQLIREIAQYALDLGMDGLMIESHISPEEAMTDKEQQITPGQLGELLEQLRFRKGHAEGTSIEQELQALRANIDQLDTELIDTLARRMDVVRRIGLLKKKHQMTAFQVKRWQEIKERFVKTGILEGLDKKFLEEILDLVHKESIRLQSDLFAKEGKQ
jgi:chorismate mutase